MDAFIKQRLDRIEQTARQILRDIEFIYGYCAGMATVARDYDQPNQAETATTDAVTQLTGGNGQ